MSNRSLRFLSIGVLAASLALSAAAAPAQPPYALTRTIPLGSPERWDLLTFEPSSQRVYVAHGDRVTVVDVERGAVVGNVERFPGGTHGVAVLPEVGRGYSDDGQAGTAASFDLKSLKILKQAKAEDDADAIVADPASGHVFVINGDPGKVTVIDPKTDSPIATIDGGGKLEIGVADGSGQLFVNGEAKREIVRIDTKSNKVTGHWTISNCTSPHGLAIDAQSRRLFASCENNLLVVVNADNGQLVSSLPIGTRTDGAAFDPIRKRVFSSNGDGTLTVISEKSPDSYAVLANIKTALGARTMTIDPQTGRLFLVAADIVVNESAAPTDFRNRFQVTPGSTKLLVLDPTP